MGGQYDKLVTVVGHQFITVIVDICVQHGGRKAPRGAGLSAAAETCRCNLWRHLATEFSCGKSVSFPKTLKSSSMLITPMLVEPSRR